MVRILKGAEVADALDQRSTQQVEELKDLGVTPILAIIRIGERGDDISYERSAIKRARKVGIAVQQVILAADVTQCRIISTIKDLNTNTSVHGVLLLRPLPAHIDEDFVRNMVAPEKDVDAITNHSLAGVFAGTSTGFAPCTPSACMEILDYYGYDLNGKKALVIGRSMVVGKPVAMMLLERNATVTIAHSRTVDLPAMTGEAQIIIACVGHAHLIGSHHLSSGQVIIDVGINVNEDGSLVGDVDFDAAADIVEALTPVPEGVGNVTTSVLMKHVAEAASRIAL